MAKHPVSNPQPPVGVPHFVIRQRSLKTGIPLSAHDQEQ